MSGTNTPLDLVLSKLRKVKPGRNGNWMAQCPVHNDPVPSLSITTGRDDRVLLNCFAGCDPHDIVERIDLDWSDLFKDDKREIPVKPERGPAQNRTEWLIKDYDSDTKAIHVRVDYQYEKQIWWKLPSGESGLGDNKLESLPLYGSHETDYEGGKAVFIVEGEKARDALASLDVNVLSTFGADHMPDLDVMLPLLRWEHVYLWPDRDRGGLIHMRRIADMLVMLGHQGVAIIVDTDANWKDDAADWIARNGTRSDLAQLCTNAMSAEEFLSDSVTGVGDANVLITPQGTRSYTINGVEYQIQYPNINRGLEATIVALTAESPEPLAADRVALDRSQHREQFASNAGVPVHDLFILRAMLINDFEHPGGEIDIVSTSNWAERAIEHMYVDPSTFIKTGFRDLDSIITGYERQQMIVVSAPTGGGKTSYMIGTLLNSIMRNITSGFISLEMTGEEIYGRLASAKSRQSFTVFRASDSKIAEHEKRLREAVSVISTKPLYLSDEVPATLNSVISYAHKLKEEADIKVLFIDQIHSIKSTGNETRNELVGQIANAFKQLARDLDIPIVTAAQMNRQQQYRKEKWPVIDDIRDSAEIGHQADMVLFVHYPYLFDQENEQPDLMQFVVAKNRNGQAGTSVKIGWHPATASFHTL